MVVTLTSKRQVTFPVKVCESMHLTLGSRLEIIPGIHEGEWVIRPLRIRTEQLAPLKGRLRKGLGKFDMNAFRNSAKDYAALRD